MGKPGRGGIPVGFREETAGRTSAQGIAGTETILGFAFHPRSHQFLCPRMGAVPWTGI